MHDPTSLQLASRPNYPKIECIPVWGTEPTPIVTPFCPITALHQRLAQLPTNQVEISLRFAQDHLQAAGMRLYVHHNTTIYYCGIQPQRLGDGSDRLVEQHLLWQDFLHSGHVPHAGDSALSSERTWVITDLSYEFCLRTLATAFELPEIEQVMVVPLRHAGQLMGCLSAFRDRTQPPWDLAQVVLAQQFAQEFAQAIHEHQLTQQVRQLSQAFAVQPGELQQIIRNMLTIWTDHSELQSSEVLGEVLRLKASV